MIHSFDSGIYITIDENINYGMYYVYWDENFDETAYDVTQVVASGNYFKSIFIPANKKFIIMIANTVASNPPYDTKLSSIDNTIDTNSMDEIINKIKFEFIDASSKQYEILSSFKHNNWSMDYNTYTLPYGAKSTSRIRAITKMLYADDDISINFKEYANKIDSETFRVMLGLCKYNEENNQYEFITDSYTTKWVNYSTSFLIPKGTYYWLGFRRDIGGTADCNIELYHVHDIIDIKYANEIISPKNYFQNEVMDTIEKIKAYSDEPCLKFFLVSDMHFMPWLGTNVKYDTCTDMITNMNAVKEDIKIDGFINLGDSIDGRAELGTEYNKRLIRYLTKKFKQLNLPTYYVLGNHDDNRYITGDAFDYNELFSHYYSNNENNNVVYNNLTNGLDYYVEYKNFGIRMIYLSQNRDNQYKWDDDTISWFTNVLTDAKTNNLSVILLTHIDPVANHNYQNWAVSNRQPVIDAINNFISSGGKYIATIYGHNHVDGYTINPYLAVTVGCQKCQNGSEDKLENFSGLEYVKKPVRTAHTYTEDLWTCLIIRPNSKKINFVRFGAGDDLEFTYE